MPPPPPPSPSYLLVISDSSSESSSEEETWLSQRQRHPQIEQQTTLGTSTEWQSGVVTLDNNLDDYSNDDGVDENCLEEHDLPFALDDHLDENDNRSMTHDNNDAARNKRHGKKKKKKRRPKQQRRDACSRAGNSSTENSRTEIKRNVSFGDVHLIEFPRRLGTEVVPGDGGWPLGLEISPTKKDTQPLEEFEALRRERLAARWKELHPGQDIPTEMETRQWDHKRKGVKNPLFTRLEEPERMITLLGTDPTAPLVSSISPSRSSPRQTRSTRKEIYSQKFNQVEVHHVRHEIETVRNHRASVGCNCRRLMVYIPPPGSGKKAQSRRMNVKQVKEELRKRHALPSGDATREQLELLLHDLVEQEPCCQQDCPCALNDIECQVDACNCYTNHPSTDYNTVQKIQECCGNKLGMNVANANEIDTYRRRFCQEIKVN